MPFHNPRSTRLGSVANHLFNWVDIISNPVTVPIYIPMLATAAVLNAIDQRRTSESSRYSNTGLPTYGSYGTQLGLAPSMYTAGFYNLYGTSNPNTVNGENGLTLHPSHTLTL